MELLVGLVVSDMGHGNGDGGDSERALVASLHTASLIRRHFTRVIGLRESRVQFDLPAGELDDAVLDELYDLRDEADAMEPLAGLAARDG